MLYLLCNIFLLPLHLGSVRCWAFPTHGVRSSLCEPLCNIYFWSWRLNFLTPHFTLFGGLQGWLQVVLYAIENATTCEEDGRQVERRDSVVNDDDGEDSERHQSFFMMETVTTAEGNWAMMRKSVQALVEL